MKCVVFAPGILGSRLRNGSGNLWPPRLLEMVRGYKRIGALMGDDVEVVDIISNVGPKSVYRTLLNDLAVCGFSEGGDDRRLIPFPYDWRKSNARSAGVLADRLDSELSGESDLSITLLGHSMGGSSCGIWSRAASSTVALGLDRSSG